MNIHSCGRVFMLLLFLPCLMQAQHGLEGIEVEKYYISSEADTVVADSMGYLPPGSVTYRIYADLYEEYRLQAVYGVPEHALRISTTTRFFNTAKGDGKMANDLNPFSFAKNPLLMLDSWISVAAACLDYMALPKVQDKDTVPSLAMNDLGLLRNENPLAGIPLHKNDGMTNIRLQATPSLFKIDYDLMDELLYERRNNSDGEIFTMDGAWAAFGGSVGLHPQNKVLIAQLTTDGVLSFELNMQLAIPDGSARKFVARNPAADEFTNAGLIYTSSPDNKAPTVRLTGSFQKGKPESGKMMEFKADVGDEDGKVIRVDWWVNGRIVASSTNAPFVYRHKYNGVELRISATATDNKGARTRCADVLIEDRKAKAH